jgi:hypothetical protein
MPAHQEIDLAHQVVRYAGRSLCLLDSLRRALHDRDQLDLVPMVDLVRQDAHGAHQASAMVIATRRRARCLRILTGLGRLSRLGGPRAVRVVHRLAEDLSSPSGAWPTYQCGPKTIP